MGKNLKGKQLGKGLGQRKDGLYYARCRNYHGEREERCFKTLPVDGVRYTKPVRAPDDIHFLTVAEQKQFLDAAKHSHNYAPYALILETGLRTGEMIGLTWDAIDWEKHTLTVNKTLEYRHKQGVWRAGPPKTESSYRTIPLTDTAIRYPRH